MKGSHCLICHVEIESALSWRTLFGKAETPKICGECNENFAPITGRYVKSAEGHLPFWKENIGREIYASTASGGRRTSIGPGASIRTARCIAIPILPKMWWRNSSSAGILYLRRFLQKISARLCNLSNMIILSPSRSVKNDSTKEASTRQKPSSPLPASNQSTCSPESIQKNSQKNRAQKEFTYSRSSDWKQI